MRILYLVVHHVSSGLGWLLASLLAHFYGYISQVVASGVKFTLWVMIECNFSSPSTTLHLAIPSPLNSIITPYLLNNLFLVSMSGTMKLSILLVMHVEA